MAIVMMMMMMMMMMKYDEVCEAAMALVGGDAGAKLVVTYSKPPGAK